MQLFGTDISDSALDRARAGMFSDTIAQYVSPERLRRFFIRTDAGYQVTKFLREDCVFARQDVTSDPPFGHTDLISCRNLLIYLDSALQHRVLPMFHYSLNPTGLLLLGTAESIASASDLFTVVDKDRRIYGRKSVPIRTTFNIEPGRRVVQEISDAPPVRSTLSGIELQKKVDLIIHSKYSPAAVAVDADLNILLFRGRTGTYLEPPPGEASFNLMRMARQGLGSPLRKGLDAAAIQNISVRESAMIIDQQGGRRSINVDITPIAGASPGERYFLVVFEEAPSVVLSPSSPVNLAPASDGPGAVARLEAQIRDQQQQLAETREYLRNATEDHEASSEELRAANEEVRSANEELQSTNEELSTTKEELQSANEELTTLNEELQHRNDELHTVNSDLLNILTAVDIPFLMVDNDLRLRRFSRAAEKVLNVRSVDIGFRLTHLQGGFDLASIDTKIRDVVDSLVIESWELCDQSGCWYSATIRPYRTIDDRIAGAVIVFLDIDHLKRTLRAAEQARDLAEEMIETVREPLLVLDRDLRIERATSAFFETFRTSRVETVGRLLWDLGNGQWNTPRLRELLGNALFRNEPFQDFEMEREFPHLGRRRVRLNGRLIPKHGEGSPTVLLAIEDITQRREEAEVRYQRLFESAKDAILVFDAETERLTDVNPFFMELVGYGRDQMVGCRLPEMPAFQKAGLATAVVAEARTYDVARYDEVKLVTSDGRGIDAEVVANLYAVGGQQVVQLNLRDVTRRNEAVQALRESEARFRLFVESVLDYALFQVDLEGNVASWNAGAQRLLGFNESEILGQSVAHLFTPEDAARGEVGRELETARVNGCAEDERWHIRKDGSRFFASGVVTPVRDDAGQLRGFAKVMRDVTAKKRAEEQLKQQAQLLELAQDVIMVRGMDGRVAFWNDAAVETFGWSKEEAMDKVAYDLLETEFPEPFHRIEMSLLDRGRWEGELIQTRKDRTQLTVWSRWTLQFSSTGTPVCVLEINSDITSRKRADHQLRASLREKEVLLKEIHHRVKNNLQVIASLLSLQSEYLEDAKSRTMLEEMNNRVRSIAVIHEVLYGSPDLSLIDFAGYLDALADDLKSFYSMDAGRIQISVDSGPLFLDITQAVPCGLIVNELLTNAFKHAFPQKRSGLIEVSFSCPGREAQLEISDNGVGFPEGLEPRTATTMGLQLLNLLVVQLKGTLEIDRSAGTRFRISFARKEA